MKLCDTPEEARATAEDPKFISKICPYSGMSSEDERVCGSWCPHFRVVSNGSTLILTCGGQECMFGLED